MGHHPPNLNPRKKPVSRGKIQRQLKAVHKANAGVRVKGAAKVSQTVSSKRKQIIERRARYAEKAEKEAAKAGVSAADAKTLGKALKMVDDDEPLSKAAKSAKAKASTKKSASSAKGGAVATTAGAAMADE